MANTLTDYLIGQRESFDEACFCDVDSLVLSTAAYLSFDRGILGCLDGGQRVPLPMVLCGVSHEELLGAGWLPRMGGKEFLTALLQSPRFMAISACNYVNDVSADSEMQFSAITFFFPDDTAYVAFRGTDNSLAGWKEDFKLAYMQEVPSQVRAREYLERIAAMNPRGIYVGGHSKGGNLAEFAAMTCSAYAYAQIKRVFNHDGPGFAHAPSTRFDSDTYNALLHKTVPQSSVFGVLLEKRKTYRIVRSSGVLFGQHASTRWTVTDNDFVTAETLGPDALIIRDALAGWAAAYEPEQLELLVDTVFDVLGSADAETWNEFGRARIANTAAVIGAVANLPADMRTSVLTMLLQLAPCLGIETAKLLRDVMAYGIAINPMSAQTIPSAHPANTSLG